jgi:hypothetical protein
MSNRQRDELTQEMRGMLVWLWRNDRRGLAVGLVRIVNAVFFAAIGAAGFPIAPITGVWLVFFAGSMAWAFHAAQARARSQPEKAQSQQDGGGP